MKNLQQDYQPNYNRIVSPKATTQQLKILKENEAFALENHFYHNKDESIIVRATSANAALFKKNPD